MMVVDNDPGINQVDPALLYAKRFEIGSFYKEPGGYDMRLRGPAVEIFGKHADFGGPHVPSCPDDGGPCSGEQIGQAGKKVVLAAVGVDNLYLIFSDKTNQPYKAYREYKRIIGCGINTVDARDARFFSFFLGRTAVEA